MSIIKCAFTNIMDTIIPIIRLKKVNGILDSKLEKNDFESVIGSLATSNKKHLLSLLERELQRKELFDNKAKTTIMGITIAITLVTSFGKMFGLINTYFSGLLFNLASVLFVFTIIYMVAAGFISINMIVNKNQVYISSLETDQPECSTIKSDIGANRIENLKRNNSVVASYDCIRNALVCILIVTVIIASSAIFTKNKDCIEIILRGLKNILQ